tara:strand:- start:3910 stop:4152 length:243 start_codon:yes stop_codon:yes gene_type:complete
MKKCDLFPVMDNQRKRLNQLAGLSNLLVSAGGQTNHSLNDLSACISIVSDLASDSLVNHERISDSVTQLSIVSDCVTGLG